MNSNIAINYSNFQNDERKTEIFIFIKDFSAVRHFIRF